MSRLLPAALFVLTAIPAAAVGPEIAAGRNVLVAVDRTEPVVAVDPGNPRIVVVGANTDYGTPVNGAYPVGAFRSTNGGRSFLSGTVPEVAPYTTAADPTVAIARDGTVFYSYLGEVPSFCSGGRSAIVVAHSIDHARSFREPVLADTSSLDDKPNMAVQSGKPDRIFLTWDRVYGHRSEIWFTRSTDGGAHFDRPRALYQPRQDSYGPVPVVGEHGGIYVLWSTFPDQSQAISSRTRILMRVSRDDGKRFGRVRTVAGPFDAIPQVTQPGSLRDLTMPAAAADGRVLWVAWAQATGRYRDGHVDAGIFVRRSGNAGKTWSQPVRVNDISSGDRFMPALTVWPDHSAGLVFYDRRRGPGSLDVYAARLWSDAGKIRVSRNIRLDTGPSPVSDIFYLAPGSTCFSPGRFFGDYIGAAAEPDGTICGVWSNAQLQRSNETDIWFTRATMPERPRR